MFRCVTVIVCKHVEQVYDDVNLTTCKANQSITWTYTAGPNLSRFIQKSKNSSILSWCSILRSALHDIFTLQALWWVAWSSWASWGRGRRPSPSSQPPTTSPMLWSSRNNPTCWVSRKFKFMNKELWQENNLGIKRKRRKMLRNRAVGVTDKWFVSIANFVDKPCWYIGFWCDSIS